MNWIIIWIAIYLGLLLFLTLKHIKSTDMEEYLVNNRNTGLWALVATTTATFVGGGTSVALMAMGYEAGFTAIWIGIAQVIGFLLMYRFAGKIRDLGAQHKLYSMPHYLNFIYRDSNNPSFSIWFARAISGVNILIFFFLLAAQFVAMASLLKFSFGIGYETAAVVSALIVIGYTALAGLSGVIITDIIQSIAIIVMIVIIFIPGIYRDTNALSRLSELPKTMLIGTHYGTAFLVALPLFFSWTVIVRMDIWQRLLAAKSAEIAKKVTIWTSITMLPFYIIFPLAGMAIRLNYEGAVNPNDVAYLFLGKHSTGFLMGFAVVGLLSALMSSGDSFLNIIAISAVKDFKKGADMGEMTANDYKWIKILTVIFGLLSLIIALTFPHIVDLMVVGLSTIVVFAPITIFALVHDNAKAYRREAMYSIVSGLVVNIGLFIFGIFRPEIFQAKSSFIPAIIIASLVLWIGVRRRISSTK